MLKTLPKQGQNIMSSGNQVFVFEVEGLCQNPQTDQNKHQIRSSSKTLMRIPGNRMNQEMRRITRLGGKIVNICPLSQYSVNNRAEAFDCDRPLASTVGSDRGQLYRVRFSQGAQGRVPQIRRSAGECIVAYEQLSATLQRLNRRGGQVLGVSRI